MLGVVRDLRAPRSLADRAHPATWPSRCRARPAPPAPSNRCPRPSTPGPPLRAAPKPQLVNRVPQRRHPELRAALASYGQARGWSPETLQRTRRSLAALLASQPTLTPTSLDAAAVRQFLIERHLTALRVVEFLTDQGLAASNQHATLDRWLACRLEPMPAQIHAEVHTWVGVLRGRGPRAGRPRKTATIQGYLRALEPALADWSARYQSLRQVTGDDITDQLEPLTGPTRLLVLVVMRSLFRALKAQR